MGDTRSHAPFAPSSSHRWLKCPQSVIGIDGLPEPTQSQAAHDGVDAHWLGEQVLVAMVMKNHYNKIPTTCNDFIGAELPSKAKVTQKMADYVQTYINYVEAHWRANGGELYIEQRVEMSKIDPRFWGSADVIQITKLKRIHVFDLKYGLWLVEVEDNTQLMSYGIGALTKFRNQVDIKAPVTAHICQPRAKHKDGPNRSTKFSIEQLIKFGWRAKAAIAFADNQNAHYFDGEHCQFCRKEFVCPKRTAFT